MELVIRSITPAVVQMNIEEVEKYMQEVKEKYVGWVVSEEEIGVAKELSLINWKKTFLM